MAKITDLAEFENAEFTENDIVDWALDHLPQPSASAFAAWLDHIWSDYDDGSGTQTNEDILKGALAYWCGEDI